MITISLVNNKGGVGKTVTTVNLGAALASIKQKVLIIDLDQQSNATQYLNRYNSKSYSIGDVMFNDVRLDEVIKQTDYDNLYIVPCSSNFVSANAKIRSESMLPPQMYLKLAFDKWRGSDFDFVLIDCPPQVEEITANALMVSDYVIVPLLAGEFALEGFITVLENLQKINVSGLSKDVEILGSLLTKADPRLQIFSHIMEQLNYLGQPYFDTFIRSSTAVEKSIACKKPIIHFEPNNNVATDYLSLAQEVLSKLGEV